MNTATFGRNRTPPRCVARQLPIRLIGAFLAPCGAGAFATSMRHCIYGADVAFETATMTRNSILQQAAISVLAQANLQPQAALTLLG